MFSGADQVIVADGKSDDETVPKALGAGALVIDAPRGRAQQLNVGAARAAGDALLFLHADTLPPLNAKTLILHTCSLYGVTGGAFSYQARGAGIWDPLLTIGGRLRHRLTGHPYGDQGIFLLARTFRALKGFPLLPVMEDWEFVRRLRRLGRVIILAEPAVTSATSFADHGFVNSSLRNLAVIVGYQLGLDPVRLAAWRNRIARRAP